MNKKTQVTVLGIFLNAVLFLAKLVTGIFSNSLALLSDAFNSLTDIASSVSVFIAVKFASKKADKEHPFGHRRAEPLAGIIVAIFSGILGFEILRQAVMSFFEPPREILGVYAIYVLAASIVAKLAIARYFTRYGRKTNSPAIKACGIDARNDVLASSIAIVGIICSMFGLPVFDSITAVIISLFIFYSGYRIAIENIDYLMGKSPSAEHIEKIKKLVRKIKGVRGLNDVKAHYVGNFIHIEIHIEVDRKISTKKSHDIGKKVEKAVEDLGDVDKAFIHIDPK